MHILCETLQSHLLNVLQVIGELIWCTFSSYPEEAALAACVNVLYDFASIGMLKTIFFNKSRS